MEDELDAYATIYTELRGSEMAPLRGQVLDRILQRVSNASVVEKFDRGEVRDMFLNGSPIVRVLALGLMEGDLSLIDSKVLLEAVSRSLTGNEQYHALEARAERLGTPVTGRTRPTDEQPSNPTHRSRREPDELTWHNKSGTSRARPRIG